MKKPVATELTGMRFGRWTVLGRAPSDKEVKWLCQCDCGTERAVLERNLKAGKSSSCGCLTRERAREAQKKDLTGRRFGKLVIAAEADPERTGGCRWLCRCDCGKECVVSARSLQTGKRTSCGCDSLKGKHRLRDVTGQRFGMLKALYPTVKRRQQGSVVWHCQCDCGNEVDVSLDRLKCGAVSSCGCMREQRSKKLAKTLVHVAGTSIDILRSEKRRSDNHTGVTGVYRKRGKFTAEIRFQGKGFYLGSYEKLEDAVLVRRRAEEELHKGTVRFYDAWKKRAELDLAWARENPIRIRVGKNEDGEFDVRMLPDIPY